MDNRSKLAIKYDAIKRYAMINLLSGWLPLYIVTEYPKSGGSWISQMLAEALGIDFPRNQAPKVKTCVMHGHNLRTPFMKNVLCVLRDGRDVMASAYFHRLFENDKNSPIMVRKTRREMPFDDYDNVRKNLPRFIVHQAETAKKSMSPGKFTWGQFVDSWRDADVVFCRYEDMVDRPQQELDSIVRELSGVKLNVEVISRIVDKYSFSSQANREPGDEDKRSFLRKGKPGDWREKFTREAAEVFDAYFGEQLISLHYEKDRGWINDCALYSTS